MAYVRKTQDAYYTEQWTGPTYGWEVVDCHQTRAEAKQSRKEYRENQPEYPVRIIKHREPIQA